MKIDHPAVLIFYAVISSWLACAPPTSSPPYEFISHHIKLQLDPVQQKLIAVDTVYLHYEKNIDYFCFLLHDSLRVDRVAIGNQNFALQPVTLREVEKIFLGIPQSELEHFEHAQIVRVDLPKSLYAEKVEIFYSGHINLHDPSEVIWHPLLPNSHSPCKVTAVIPFNYRFTLPGNALEERVDQDWRLVQWSKTESEMVFPKVEQTNQK